MSPPASAARPPPARAPTLAIVLLSVAAFASAANMRVVDPLLVQLAAAFGVSVGAASIAATSFLFANGVFVLVHGPFGDRYGKMPVVAVACLAAALCCLLSATADSLAWLTAARFLTGVTGSAIIPLAIAWLGDNVGYEQRQATLARFLTGQTLGLMTGAALGGALGDWLGWRSVFWVLAAIYVAAGGALFGVMRAHPDIARPAGNTPGSMVGQMLTVLRRSWVITVVLVVALEGGVFWGAFTFVGADLHHRFDMGFAAIGLAVAAFGAGGFAYVLVAPQLVRLLGERGLCVWGGLGLGLAFATMALAPSPEVEFAGIVLSGVSFYMLHNTLQTHGTQMAPQARGAAMALFALCLFVGQAIGVPVAAPIVDRWGAPPVFWTAAVVLPALGLWFAAALRRRARLAGQRREAGQKDQFSGDTRN
jgi:MFS transporter, YNFM family, putative membrane transport protein